MIDRHDLILDQQKGLYHYCQCLSIVDEQSPLSKAWQNTSAHEIESLHMTENEKKSVDLLPIKFKKTWTVKKRGPKTYLC